MKVIKDDIYKLKNLLNVSIEFFLKQLKKYQKYR